MAKLVVPPTLSVLVSIWMETLFYGINFVVFLICSYVFFSGGEGFRSTKGRVYIISTILFLVVSAHMGVNLCRLIEGYVLPESKEAMTTYLLDITQVTNVAKQFLLAFTYLFSDILIIWRVFIVWEKRWSIIVLPVMLCIGSFTSALADASLQAMVIPGQTIFIKNIDSWGTALMAFFLCTNVLCTTLIASRIWWCTRTVREFHHTNMQQYWRVIILVVESACFAAVAQTLELGFYAAKFPGIYFISDTTVQIVAMTPLILIAFIGLTSRQTGSSWASSHITEPTRVSTLRFQTDNVISIGGGLRGTTSFGAMELNRKPHMGKSETTFAAEDEYEKAQELGKEDVSQSTIAFSPNPDTRIASPPYHASDMV